MTLYSGKHLIDFLQLVKILTNERWGNYTYLFSLTHKCKFTNKTWINIKIIYVCNHTHISACVCIYIYIYIYLIEHSRHFLSTYFFVNLFELSYWSYDIWQELVDKYSIISYFPSTFSPTLGHHQGRMYYKSDVTFECTLLLCKKSVCTVVLCIRNIQPKLNRINFETRANVFKYL